jgi:PAS domain S-box-containing protein
MESRDARNRAVHNRMNASDDRYRFLLENSADILWTVDLNGTWQFMTENVEKIAHIQLKDIIGKKVWDFVAPECVRLLKEKLQRRMRGEDIPPYEVIVIDGHGRRAPFEVKTSPIRDGKGEIIGVQGISRDLTERKQAEEAVRKSEEKFRNLIESIYDWVWEIDDRYTFTYSSPRVLDYLGYRPEEILGRSIYDFTKPEHAKRLSEILDSLVRGHGQFAVAEKTLIGKSGEPVYFEMNVTPVYNGDGTLRGFRGICRDIRDRKRAEDALRRAYAELEHRVEERTRELAEAKSQAELYLDLMSHDINNMNMVALGNLEMLQGMVAGDKNATRLMNGALEMLRSSSRLIEIVSKLQQAGKGGMEMKMIDLCDILEDVKKKYSKMPDRKVKITVRYHEQGKCLVTANRLAEDIFSNLVGNSIKHSARDQPVVIDIDLSRVNEEGKDFFMVTIEDHGPGIPDELKSKLFSRLERGKTKASGKGLGLYLVKTLAEGFEGKVWVEDRVSGDFRKGSRFTILLPASQA